MTNLFSPKIMCDSVVTVMREPSHCLAMLDCVIVLLCQLDSDYKVIYMMVVYLIIAVMTVTIMLTIIV